MYILKTDQMKIQLIDYVYMGNYIAFDAKLESKTDMEMFLKNVSEFSTGAKMLDYEVEGKMYNGHFGNVYYDENRYIRFYMTTNKEEDEDLVLQSVWSTNVERILLNQRSAILKAVQILQKTNMADKTEISEIMQLLAIDDYGYSIGHKVSNVKEFLELSCETLEDLRKNQI